jgi:mRNA interferase MazF
MLRGELWVAVWPNDPNAKPRPVLIVSNNNRNQKSNFLDVVVVKVTSLFASNGKKKLVNSAEDVEIKLKQDSIIRCGSIYSIEKTILNKKIKQLTLAEMTEVDEKLKTVLDIC